MVSQIKANVKDTVRVNWFNSASGRNLLQP